MFMLETHGENYIDPKTNKAYWMDVDRYAHYRHFLDERKLLLHPFRALVVVNCQCLEKAFYVLDPVNKKKDEIPDLRIKLNKFVVRNNLPDEGYAVAEPLMENGEGEEAEYISLNGQRTRYDCAIYVKKWIEIIDLRKIKNGKRYQYKTYK
ncbi:hypothetical protein AHAS_Ahas10G0118100 [Arachis hypogaea]